MWTLTSSHNLYEAYCLHTMDLTCTYVVEVRCNSRYHEKYLILPPRKKKKVSHTSLVEVVVEHAPLGDLKMIDLEPPDQSLFGKCYVA